MIIHVASVCERNASGTLHHWTVIYRRGSLCAAIGAIDKWATICGLSGTAARSLRRQVAFVAAIVHAEEERCRGK